jgi:hypothetical protein
MSMSWYLPLILRFHLRPNFLQPRGLQIQRKPNEPQEALLQEEEEVKQGIDGPTNGQVRKETHIRINTVGNQ